MVIFILGNLFSMILIKWCEFKKGMFDQFLESITLKKNDDVFFTDILFEHTQ